MKSFDPTWGGPGTYTVELVNRLVGLAGEHEYVLIYPRNVTARVASAPQRGGAVFSEIDTQTRGGIVWDQMVLPCAAAGARADLLFSPFMSIPLRGAFKKAFTIHGAERYVVPGMLRADQYLRWFFMDKILVHAADRIIAVSETMGREYCRATGCDPDKVRAVPLGVSEVFRVVDEPEALARTKEKHALPQQYILFVGRLFPNKNFGNLLRAFARIASQLPHRLVVAGGVRWKYQQDLKLVTQLGLAERVSFLDFVSQDDLINLYNMADCFVYPSFYESFGLAQIEAMACGCPVVAANTGALPEIAGDAALFCDPHDPAAIAAAILRMVSDRELRAGQVAKGLARAKQYTWDRCAAATAQVLDEIS